MFLPESFADLVLDKPAEECSLKWFAFDGDTAIIAGPRVSLALTVLEERGVVDLGPEEDSSYW